MPESFASYLSTAPSTSELYAPTLLQVPNDFPSTVISTSTDTTVFNTAGYKDLDYSRLLYYKEPTSLSICSFTSWIYG
jgi:hypothetical protein